MLAEFRKGDMHTASNVNFTPNPDWAYTAEGHCTQLPHMKMYSVALLTNPDLWDIDLFLMIEAMQSANRAQGFTAYDLCYVSSEEIRSPSLLCNSFDHLIVSNSPVGCAEHNADANAFIRHHYRTGSNICAVGSGVFQVARAGIISGKAITLPNEHSKIFSELYPEAQLVQCPFTSGGRLHTCAGGINVLHLMTHLISMDLGRDVALKVADRFHIDCTMNSDKAAAQTSHFLNSLPRPLKQSLLAMSDAIDAPRPLPSIAQEAKVSMRQLQRLFLKYLGTSPSDHYRLLRLDCAREILLRSHMTVTEVAMMTGFTSHSHFSKSFRDAFGICPSEVRT
ncbi:MAG: helix-turn-helix domain-containing protein [Rhodospirillales bacterium]